MLPGHKRSYKRAVLLQRGESLATDLVAESVLHELLRANGEQLFLGARAVIRHLNFAQFRVFLPAPGRLRNVSFTRLPRHSSHLCGSREF